MNVTPLLVAFLAVCGSALAFDWARANHLLRELRDFEAYEELQKRRSEPRCAADADVVFILDRSRSIYPPDFEKGKLFVQEVVKLFSPTSSRFAAITFAEGATVDFSLDTHGNDQKATLNAIKNIEQRPEIGGQTQTWAALELLYSKVLARQNLRAGVQPTVLLITDGASQEADKTAAEAKKAHDLGIKIIAIGIGKEPRMSELNAIATDPDSQNVHMVENYGDALSAIKNDVASQVCPSNIEDCDNNNPLDVMFSLSEHANGQETSYTFGLLLEVMKKATIGPGNIQFGLARRDCGNAWDQISLNELDTADGFKSEFGARVRAMRSGLVTRLNYLSNVAFKTGDQPSAKNVPVIFIDRKSDINDAVKSKIKEMNNVILVVGGGVTAADVSGLGADVITFTTYDNIKSISQDILDKLCEALRD